jgi:hypothetical protein
MKIEMCAIRLKNPTRNIHIRKCKIFDVNVDIDKEIVKHNIDRRIGFTLPNLSTNIGENRVPQNTPIKLTEPIIATQNFEQ